MSPVRGKFVIDSPSGLGHIRSPFQRETRVATRSQQCIVYYLERGDGLIKIGTTANYTKRRKSLLRQYGPLSLVAWESGSYELEKERHKEFWWERQSLGNEWFYPRPYLIDHILNLRALLA